MDENGIKTEVWSPLGHGSKRIMNHPLFEELAKKYNKSPVQIVLRWHIQNNNIVFPQSTSKEHIESNIDIFDFEISNEDMERIALIDKNKSIDLIPAWIQYPFLLICGLTIMNK